MKIAVLGPTGMLGHMVASYLSRAGHSVRPVTFRMDSRAAFADIERRLTVAIDKDVDVVVNCIGAIKPRFAIEEDISVPIFVNAIFPRLLADHCQDRGRRLIHVTTDCVYSGELNPIHAYKDSDGHDARDAYGKSKSLGEPENAVVIRTSIIGPEKRGRASSLLEWVLSHKDGETIKGFSHHLWSGMTTLQLAKVIDQAIIEDWQNGAYTVASETVTKLYLLRCIIGSYDRKINVEEVFSPPYVNRSMLTSTSIEDRVSVPTIAEQIEELSSYGA